MGQFSWITQDTDEAIRESYGCSDKSLTTAYMHDDKGNVWFEDNYEGYGKFGGKDYFVLLAEMNGHTGDHDELRGIGIDLSYDERYHKSPNLTRNKDWEWVGEEPEKDPNQGWGDGDEEE